MAESKRDEASLPWRAASYEALDASDRILLRAYDDGVTPHAERRSWITQAVRAVNAEARLRERIAVACEQLSVFAFSLYARGEDGGGNTLCEIRDALSVALAASEEGDNGK